MPREEPSSSLVIQVISFLRGVYPFYSLSILFFCSARNRLKFGSVCSYTDWILVEGKGWSCKVRLLCLAPFFGIILACSGEANKAFKSKALDLVGIFSFPLPVLKTNSNVLFEESPSEKDLSVPEPECQNQLPPPRIVSGP